VTRSSSSRHTRDTSRQPPVIHEVEDQNSQSNNDEDEDDQSTLKAIDGSDYNRDLSDDDRNATLSPPALNGRPRARHHATGLPRPIPPLSASERQDLAEDVKWYIRHCPASGRYFRDFARRYHSTLSEVDVRRLQGHEAARLLLSQSTDSILGQSAPSSNGSQSSPTRRPPLPAPCKRTR
jgi:hypothetical protein